MTKPALRLMVSEKGFRAIGHVAAQWAYLETQLDFVVDLLPNQPSLQPFELKPHLNGEWRTYGRPQELF
jgi:hypothetical protein